MGDQTKIEYPDGDVVWVKLGSCWWPGEVVGPEKLPPDVLRSFRKPPIAVVKFFQEDTYEYVRNTNNIFKYNCSRKTEFINKGLYMYRTKHGHMEKFPEDVIRAETAVGGDIEILTRDEFQEVKKESYAGLFGESAKKSLDPASSKKGRGRGRLALESPKVSTPVRKPLKEKTEYKVHILLQKKEPAPETPSTPSTSRASDVAEDRTPKQDPPTPAISGASTPATPVSGFGTYACPSCHFTTNRLNVLILHNKTHSVTYTPYTPSPIPKKSVAKTKTKSVSPKVSKTPKTPQSRKEKVDKPPKKSCGKRAGKAKVQGLTKKPKTDAEIKSDLLADWDDIDDDSIGESTELTAGAESPAIPTSDDLPSAQVPEDISSNDKAQEPVVLEKPEDSSDSKYEFCEDEDWPVEADLGRRIPRVKNLKRKENSKSLSLDEEQVAREVAELLNKTALPELPSIPEPLKVEENFPEPSVIKSPDKKPEIPSETKPPETVAEPKKAIFKTKTFFRSRHSRSQDAIGKYVAEQLNAVERMDVDSDLNGSEAVSSPEARESPPVEPVKVARLAPKIQLKKMKAEAAQLREKEKSLSLEKTMGNPELEQASSTNKLQDVLWGTQEIKPINKETPEKYPKESWRDSIGRESFSSYLSPKRRLLEERLQVSNKQETITSPKPKIVEGRPVKVSSDTIEITIPEKYIHPHIDTEYHACTSTTEPTTPLLETSIDVTDVTDTESTERYFVTSPEKRNSQSPMIVTTPKKSPLKLSPQNTEISPKSPIKSPQNIEINPTSHMNSPQKIDFNPTSPMKTPQKIEVDPTSPIQSPQKVEVNPTTPVKSPQKTDINPTSPMKTPQNLEVDPTSPIKSPHKVMVNPTSPVKSPQKIEVDPTSPMRSPQKIEVDPTSPIKSPQKIEVDLTSPMKSSHKIEVDLTSSIKGPQKIDINPISPIKGPQMLDINLTSPTKTSQKIEVDPTSPMKGPQKIDINPTSPTKTSQKIEVDPTSPMKTSENIDINSTIPMKSPQKIYINPISPTKSLPKIYIKTKSPMKTLQNIEVDPTSPMKSPQKIEVNQTSLIKTSQKIEVDPTSPMKTSENMDIDTTIPMKTSPIKTLQKIEVDPTLPMMSPQKIEDDATSIKTPTKGKINQKSPVKSPQKIVISPHSLTKMIMEGNQQNIEDNKHIDSSYKNLENVQKSPIKNVFGGPKKFSVFKNIKKTPIENVISSFTEVPEYRQIQKSPINIIIRSPKKVPEIKQTSPVHTMTVKSLQVSPVTNVDGKTPKTTVENNQFISDVLESPQNSKELSSEIVKPYMSDSTASAVDALLSVSRESDRVPKIVSHDLPEDLFEDDHKDSNNDEETLNCNVVQFEDKCEQQPMEIDTNHDLENQQSSIEIDKCHDRNGISNQNTDITQQENSSNKNEDNSVLENLPSESDLQIAEALINLPSTAMKNKVNECKESIPPINIHSLSFDEPIPSETETQNIEIKSIQTQPSELKSNESIRFETEQEKSENFRAAQSLVQMSESIEHKKNMAEKNVHNATLTTSNKRKSENISIEQQLASLTNDNNCGNPNDQSPKYQTTSSKLMKMLEEPGTLKPPASFKNMPIKQQPTKQIIVTGKEKILNFDVAKSSKIKSQAPKQKIIIRRAGPAKGISNNLSEVVASPDKIILSRSNVSTDGSSVQTFTIQGTAQESQPDDVKQLVLQPKFHKVAKTPTKVQKLKQSSLIAHYREPQVIEQSPDMFDINSMPVVLSDDILTPESIEKMPVVMSDGNMIQTSTSLNPPKLIKTKPAVVENEKVVINQVTAQPKKSEVKSLIMSSTSESTKATPNILKSSKMRSGKPMLVIDKATGMQKFIMAKPEPVLKEFKQAPSLIQQVPQNTTKTEKFIILPSNNPPRPSGRTQKIVIDPQTGKAHMLLPKGQDSPQSASDNKPVPAKLIPSSTNIGVPGNTVMIITNAQGAQSRIMLTPEHEKILFPNKQQASGSQIKAVSHRISTNPGITQKTAVTTNAGFVHKTIVTSTPIKHPQKVKQKSAIITSKGQLIVGGRVATTVQNIAPMPEVRHIANPEIRPAVKQEMRPLSKIESRPILKRIVANEPKKLLQQVHNNSSESFIFLRQKNGAVIQLTASQFEHLQRSGQIVQKVLSAPEKKIVVQKSLTIPSNEPIAAPTTQRQRVRKSNAVSHSPAKRARVEACIAPALQPPVPPLTSLSSAVVTPARPTQAPTVTLSSIIPTVISTAPTPTTQSYADLENFEELLPSTAIARPPEPVSAVEPQPELIVEQMVHLESEQMTEVPAAQPADTQLMDTQLTDTQLTDTQLTDTQLADTQLAEPQLAITQLADLQLTDAQLADTKILALPGESVGGIAGTFYLCIHNEENNTYTPIDNRPLILENNQLVPIEVEPVPLPVYQQPERRDILEAALANSDVFQESPPERPDFRDLNANVSVHCRVSETSSTLNQPIMTPVEMPTKGNFDATTVPSNLEDGLAVIGVTPHSVPTSLELPITVTDPRIAPKTTDPFSNNNYGTTLIASPNADMSYISVSETHVSGISMPLLTDDESVGKSMPILTDEVVVSSVESMPILTDEVAVSSVESIECDDAGVGAGWARRLLTPGGSDTSELSAEIPLQPHIQLSLADISRNT